MAEEPENLPEATEQIHLPEPSYLPVVVAFGVTLAIVGVVLSVVLVIIGLLVVLTSLVRWIRQTRSEMSELPLSH